MHFLCKLDEVDSDVTRDMWSVIIDWVAVHVVVTSMDYFGLRVESNDLGQFESEFEFDGVQLARDCD